MSRLWSSILAEKEAREEASVLRLPAAEWRKEINRRLRCSAPGQIVATLASILALEEKRARLTKPVQVAPPRDSNWELWKDMVEEPWKYGESIVDWLDLDEEIRAGPNAWRVDRYWQETQREEDLKDQIWRTIYSEIAKEVARAGFVRLCIKGAARRDAAVRRIQPVVRGHQARTKLPFRDCCMCLAHRTSPIRTDVGWMCHACAEQGPYEDTTGPLSDPWNWSRATKA